MVRVGFLLALGACSFEIAAAPGSGSNGDAVDAPLLDSGIDPEVDANTTCTGFVPLGGHVNPCSVPAGGGWDVMADTTYNTTAGTVSTGTAPMSYAIGDVRIVSVSDFTIGAGATLRVTGDKPLLVLSWSTLRIDGTLDVSSRRILGSQSLGAGANTAACSGATNGTGTQDCGGGGGGGFRGGGGNGGAGGNAAGKGGDLLAVPSTVVGGCSGTNGGTGGSKGYGGAGGGAAQLTARSRITVSSTGRLAAGGAGGEGGTGDGGGGGGGSGGYLGFAAPMVQLAQGAIIAANGGGGGTGCDGGDGPEGENGRLDAVRAAGGTATVCATARAGGLGGAGIELTGGVGSSSPESGGGGGGGTGHVLAWGTLTNMATISPAITAQ